MVRKGIGTAYARLATVSARQQPYDFKQENPKRNLRKYKNFATKLGGGVNFTKEIPLKEICESLRFLLKKVRGINLKKKNTFKQNLHKISNFCSKSEAGFNFTKEIPLNEISENL